MDNLATHKDIEDLINHYRNKKNCTFTTEELDKIEKVMLKSIGDKDEA